MFDSSHLVVPAQAGTQASTRKMLSEWRDFRGALLRVLCLADPRVPAFAGTTMEQFPAFPTHQVRGLQAHGMDEK
jgi:hypothetical protein